jgi:formylglycine-generating enzyme required for sulfatase activity
LLAGDRADNRTDFSGLPPLDSQLLEQVSQPSLGISLADDDEGDRLELRPRPKERPGVPSRPSQRIQAEDYPTPGASPSKQASGAREPDQSLRSRGFEEFPSRPHFEDAGGSMPLLENIWEDLDKIAPPPTSASQQTALPVDASSPPLEAAEREHSFRSFMDRQVAAAPPSPEAAEYLLKRSPQSALEHLKKASTVKREEMSNTRLTRTEFQPPANVELDNEVSTSPAIIKPRPAQWTPMRMLMMLFAISGLSGIGLLAYQYYDASREQGQQEAAALQQRQAEEARRAQEEAQHREREIAGHLERARQAIAARNWALANSYLDRATVLKPDHPALAATRAELAAAQNPQSTFSTLTQKTSGLELNWIEGGCFSMGSPPTERDRSRDETPRRGCIKGFWMGKTEVTNGQFRRFRPTHDSGSFQNRSLNEDSQPVVNLNWGDAKAFAEWLSWEAGSNQRFRLPTEAEWEYAARAGATTRYSWGNNIDPSHANFSDRNDPTGSSIGSMDDGYAVTAPVGSYLPNAMGLYDMAGNVWEWTCSDYNPNYDGAEQRCSTLRPNEGQRVVRGGSWNNGAGDLRVARRLARKPDHRDAMTGFRIVLEESGTSPATDSR